MRYVITFFDRSTRRVTPEAAMQFMAAMHDGGNVLYKGQMYSGKTISSIKTLFGFFLDKLATASAEGRFFCKYGHEHADRLDCACKDAGMEKMFTPEELPLLKSWDDEAEKRAMHLLSPPAQHAIRSHPYT